MLLLFKCCCFNFVCFFFDAKEVRSRASCVSLTSSPESSPLHTDTFDMIKSLLNKWFGIGRSATTTTTTSTGIKTANSNKKSYYKQNTIRLPSLFKGKFKRPNPKWKRFVPIVVLSRVSFIHSNLSNNIILSNLIYRIVSGTLEVLSRRLARVGLHDR